jgi:hypothetical protein
MPERLERELGVIDDLSTETLETTPVRELEKVMDERLGPVGDGLDAAGSVGGGTTELASYATGT